jgi:hypothetical protein
MAKRKQLYSPHPGIAMVQKWLAELPAKTGRSLDAWLSLIAQSGPPDEKGRRAWLKEKFGMGTNSAMRLAERSLGKGSEDDDPDRYLEAADKYVEAMFSGGKAGLRPLYDKLLKLGLAVGKDAKASPCQTIVPLYRNHVFAQIKPATNTRIDMGFALKDTPATGRLIDTGGFAKKDRITHRIPIVKLEDIDGEITAWLHKAYEMDA